MPFRTYSETRLANIVQCHAGQVMRRSATVDLGRFGPFMALCEDRFCSFQANHFVLHNMTIDNSYIQYARNLFRPIIPNFQISPMNFDLLYCVFTIHWLFFIFRPKHFCRASMSVTSVPSSFCWHVLVHFVVALPHSSSVDANSQ